MSAEPHQAAARYTAGVLVTGQRVLRPGWLEVSGGRVTAVGEGPPPADGTGPAIHLGPGPVVPGFVDVHVHGGGGGSFTDGDRDSALRAVAVHRRHGTTTMLASLVTAGPDQLRELTARTADLVDEGLVAGIHLEGPWLSERRCGAHDADLLRDPDLGEVASVLRAGRGRVAMVTLAPERSGGLAAIRAVTEAGALAAVGHTDAGYEQTRQAIDAGARVATHLFNAMRPLHHREPGPILALQDDPRVLLELVLDGHHLHPALYAHLDAAVGAERIALVTDAMAAAGKPDGRYRLGGLQVAVRDGLAVVAGTGTIAGSTATADGLFRRAVDTSRAGGDAALLAAVRQTSANPARAFGWADRHLEPGGRADLVVLDPEHAVRGVLQAGTWVVEPPGRPVPDRARADADGAGGREVWS